MIHSKSIHKASLLALTLLVVNNPSFADTTSDNLLNAKQESQIWTTFALSPYLRASLINVSVTNGKATLTGRVEEDVNKELATQIALGVKGITSVDNNIIVDSDFAPPAPSTERSYGTLVDDYSITARIKSKIL